MPRLRAKIKNLACLTLGSLGFPDIGLYVLRHKVLILTYHSFCLERQNRLLPQLDIRIFERQLAFLKKKFDLKHLEEGFPAGGPMADTGRPVVCLTMDDGYEDNYSLLYPLLQRYQAPVTIFICTDFVDTGRPPWTVQLRELFQRTTVKTVTHPFEARIETWAEKANAARKIKQMWLLLPAERRFSELERLKEQLEVSGPFQSRPIAWDQVRLMRGPLVHFGSHTVFHGNLTKVDESEADFELKTSKSRIEQMLDCECASFAYPDGDWALSVAEKVKRAGYRIAVTQDKGTNDHSESRLQLKRIHIPEDESWEVFKCRCTGII
jgi:peptidoglycan/xylan/chitin deacetylase (PgdA/CDA1 family)